MSVIEKREQFSKLILARLTAKEADWIQGKINIISIKETQTKFNMFFSLVARFISNDEIKWTLEELKALELIYPGFSKSKWSKQDLTRVLLMMHLDPTDNKKILDAFYEIAEMQELVAVFKGFYLLENAHEFTKMMEEGIRTNMVNVFNAMIEGNPYGEKYLEEWAWNQLVLKTFFLDCNLYTIENIDNGKNENLANMLQDYVKERWAANRMISPEIWRMIEGYLRDDVKSLLSNKTFGGVEKEAIERVLNGNKVPNSKFWDDIGKNK